ncbi:hypothetical protein MMC13_004237 [Lambiella insularis]|nr:hypothetical protein [Lambiella insularis]
MASAMSSTSKSTVATTITVIETTSKTTTTLKTTSTTSSTTMSHSTSTSTTSSMTTPKTTAIFSTITSLTTKLETVMTTPLMTTSKTTAVLVVTSIVTTKPTTTSMMMATSLTSHSTTASTTTKTIVATTMPTTSSVSVQVIQVSTANDTGALIFTPNSVTAAVGSLVQFQFHPMNHSVVQADFNHPCIPVASITPAIKGIFSGFQATTGATTPIFTILINNTAPIWYYCSQGMHCQAGMVGVINPPANETIAQFAALAKLATQNLSPGQMVMNTTTAMNTTKVNTTATMTAPLNIQTHAGAGSLGHSLLGVGLAAAIALLGMVAL